METVNNLINTASKAIYGENNTTTDGTTQGTSTTTQHQQTSSLLGDDNSKNTTGDSLLGDDTSRNTTRGTEPLSGQTGAGTANQPYDAGNTTGEPTNTTSSSTGSSLPGNTSSSSGPSTSTSSNLGAAANAAQDVGSARPDSGSASTTKQQGADRPHEEPGSQETHAINSKTNAAEEAMSGGDSSESRHSVGGSSGGRSAPHPNESAPKPLGGGAGSSSKSDDNKDEALGSVSNEPGTGEKYIKSSGTKANGGDFDAANAGAGREADRLLEEKGIVREPIAGATEDVPDSKAPGEKSVTGTHAHDKTTDKTTTDTTDKPSMGQKLKDKLHIGHSKKE